MLEKAASTRDQHLERVGVEEEAAPAAPTCRNCENALRGDHCHICGQKARIHDTVAAIAHDLSHSVLHLEGKLWRTLPLLALRPGVLTRRYVDGERARFVSPMAAFLFSFFLMFAAFGLAGGPITTSAYDVRIGNDHYYYVPTLAKAQEKLRSDRNQLIAHRGRLVEQGAPAQRVADADRGIATLGAAISTIEKGKKEATSPPAAAAAAAAAQQQGARTVDLSIFFRWMFHKIGENPPLVIQDVQNKAYKFSWALVPISVPFLWLLMLGNPRNRLYNHTVFVTYSLSFVTLLLVVMTLARPLGLIDAIAVPFPFVVAWHMYRQLRGAYRLSAPQALWRAALLLVFALIASLLFIALLVALA
jgi:hypothetical protein